MRGKRGKKAKKMKQRFLLMTGVLCVGAFFALAGTAMATLTFNATSVTGTDALVLDGSGALTLGGTNATSLTLSHATATTTVSGPLLLGSTVGTLTLQNGATIDNTVSGLINLAGAGETTMTRVGLFRAGCNGYSVTGELGCTARDPVTITSSSLNRAGAEFYYGYSGTSGTMRGIRLLFDAQAPDNSTAINEMNGADLEVRGNSDVPNNVTMGRAVLAEVVPKASNVFATAIGVESSLDNSGNATTWKAFDIDGGSNAATSYGLYFESSTAGHITKDISLQNGDTITNSAAGTITFGSAALTTTGALTVASTTDSGTLGVTGNFAVNTNKFQVTAANGNTLVAGTLGVTGTSTLGTTIVGSALNKGTCLAGAGQTCATPGVPVVSASAICVTSDKTHASATIPSVDVNGILTVSGGTTGDTVNYICF